jgi:hypothetical protein
MAVPKLMKAADLETHGAALRVAPVAVHGSGVEKYGSTGVLVSSADRGWSGLSAELRTHKTMETKKTYSNASNAKRAAIAAGHKEGEFAVYKITDGKFAFRMTLHRLMDPAKTARPAKAVRTAKAAKPREFVDGTARDGRKLAGKRAAVLADAQAGKLPPPPDFTAPTHARYRDAAKALVEMAKAGDIEGLKAVVIKPYSSSPKAMAKYRDLAVIALEARRAATAA